MEMSVKQGNDHHIRDDSKSIKRLRLLVFYIAMYVDVDTSFWSVNMEGISQSCELK